MISWLNVKIIAFINILITMPHTALFHGTETYCKLTCLFTLFNNIFNVKNINIVSQNYPVERNGQPPRMYFVTPDPCSISFDRYMHSAFYWWWTAVKTRSWSKDISLKTWTNVWWVYLLVYSPKASYSFSFDDSLPFKWIT